MTEYVRRHMTSARAVSPWLWWTGLFAILVLGPTTVLLSEDGSYFNTVEDSPLFSDQLTGRSGQALGAVARGGYFTGPAVGRVKGIAPLELMPYMFFDQGMVLGDIRGFRADNGYWGTNLGLGYRHYVSPWDRIFGVNFFYDYDNTSTKIFRQIGFGLETYGEWWDMRGNAYFPVGTQSQLLNTQVSPGSQQFSGHQLLFDLINTYGTALKGADAEIGIPLSIFGEAAQVHDLRMYAGGYHYESDASGGFNGWSGRIQGDLIPSLLLQLIVTNDSHFDTNVVFGATWSFGGFKQAPEERRNQFSRMTTPIWRQYTISIDRTDVLIPDQVAVNPATGNPYFIDHVDSSAAGVQDGTFENPFQNIGQTNPDAASGVLDIVYVHGNSVYNLPPNNAIDLQTNANYSANRPLRYFGEGAGITHTIPVVGLNSLALPAAPAGSIRPTFNNAIGNGVQLDSYTQFSGFIINGSAGNGIFGGTDFNGDPVHDVLIDQVDVTNSGGSGMFFNNAGQGIVITQSQITGPTGIAFLVDGGTPQITFRTNVGANDSTITNSGNAALVVRNTLAGSSVDLTGADINNTGSVNQGILFNNVAGTVTVGDALIDTAGTNAIEIVNNTGNFRFVGDVSITSPVGDGILISNLNTTSSSVAFLQGQSVGISNRNQAGINLLNNQGTITFGGETTIGDIASGTAAGINWQGNAGSTTFSQILITDSGGDAFALGTTTANTGNFTVLRDVTIGQSDTGNIAGVGINIANNTSGTIRFASNVGINLRTNEGIRIHDNAGAVTFNGTSAIVTVNNDNASTSSAVDIQNNTGNITFPALVINDATAAGVDGYGAGLNVVDNPSTVNIARGLTITATDGIALFANNVGTGDTATGTGGLQIQSSTSFNSILTTTGLPTIDIEDSRYQIALTQVNNTGSIREGIRLVDDVGMLAGSTGTAAFKFRITGLANQGLPGGTIDSAGAQGVLLDNADGVQLLNMIISNSTLAGVRAVDTQFIDIENSTFENNGTTGANPSINLISQTPDISTIYDDVYNWVLFGNLINHTVAGPAVSVTTTNSGAGSQLVFVEQSNQITLFQDGSPTTRDTTTGGVTGTTVNWNGNINAAFVFNQYNLAAYDVGIFFKTTQLSTNPNTTILNILSNDFQGSGGGNTGIDISTAGASNITIGQQTVDNPNSWVGNQFNFNQNAATPLGATIFDTAMRFSSLAAGAIVNIDSNQSVQINSDGGTLIDFVRIFAPTGASGNIIGINLSNNNMSVTDPNFPGTQPERGVIIESVIGGGINIESLSNNTIILDNGSGTGTILFSAPSAVNGNFLINNALVPGQ